MTAGPQSTIFTNWMTNKQYQYTEQKHQRLEMI